MNFEKLNSFVQQLLNSAAIKNLAPYEKEENVYAFILQNEEKLKMTLTSPEYFPEVDWKSLKMEISRILGEAILEQMKPHLESLILKSLKFEWKKKYNDFMISDEKFKEEILNLVLKLATRYNSRQHYGHILSFMQNNVIHPYINSVYQNKRYVYNGLSRFDAVNYKTPDESIDFIYSSLLLLPLYDINLPGKAIIPQYSGPPSRMFSFAETENNSILRRNFIGKIKEIINKEFPGISPYFLDIITNTFYLSEDDEKIKYSSKLLKTVYNFAIQWKKVKRERGAESFDASWYNVARINYKFYAYDLGTLDEFYKITIEEDL